VHSRGPALAQVLDHVLSHRQGPLADVHRQQQRALRIDGRPHPVAGARQAGDGVLFTDLTILDTTQHGIQLVELQLMYMYVTKKVGGKGPKLLCCFHQPVQDGVCIDLKDPCGGPHAHPLRQARQDADDQLH
jgi:hypothetical protein